MVRMKTMKTKNMMALTDTKDMMSLRLNGGPDYSPTTEKLLVAYSIKRKGSGKLKGASSISKERENAEKALRLNGNVQMKATSTFL